MMTNKGRTTLYCGVTNSLVKRVSQHRNAEVPGFTQRYNITVLVYYEEFRNVKDAIAREKQLKKWSRSKKEELIAGMNPRWSDLAVTVLGLKEAPAKRWRERGSRSGDPSTGSG